MKNTTNNFDRKKEFEKDLEWGKWGENLMIDFVQQFLSRKNKQVKWTGVSNTKKTTMKFWDLDFNVYTNNNLSPSRNFKVEVKTDGYDSKTGNLIFEKSCGGEKSGVFATKAEVFLYFLPLYKSGNIYIIHSEVLKKILTEKYSHCIISGGDYGSKTFMYRIPRNEFDEIFLMNKGKIETFKKYEIPEHFEKKEFIDGVIYHSDNFRDYENPFDF